IASENSRTIYPIGPRIHLDVLLSNIDANVNNKLHFQTITNANYSYSTFATSLRSYCYIFETIFKLTIDCTTFIQGVHESLNKYDKVLMLLKQYKTKSHTFKSRNQKEKNINQSNESVDIINNVLSKITRQYKYNQYYTIKESEIDEAVVNINTRYKE
ncbi:hypothetical protein RFI_38536, partial [Reticulomyxa filosa]